MKLLLALLFVSTAFATDRFVSPSGNDANSGTLASPYRTPEKCEAAMVDGDTCYLRAGQYALSIAPVLVYGQKSFAQYGADIVDLRLSDGSTVRFTGSAATWNSPDLSLVQMLTLGRFGAAVQPNQTVYVELYLDGSSTPSAVNFGPSLPLLLNYTLQIQKSPKATTRSIQIRVHQ